MSKYINALNQLNNTKNTQSYAKTSNWVMSIMDPKDPAVFLTISDNTAKAIGAVEIDLNNTSPIYEFEFGLSRRFNQQSVLNLWPGALSAHEVKVVVPLNSLLPSVRTIFFQNVLVPEIKIVRLAVSGVIVQKEYPIHSIAAYHFYNVYITGVADQYDDTALSIRYSNVTYSKCTVNQLTGISNGIEIASYFDVSNYQKLSTGSYI